jgi:hypothetical protein
MPSDGKSSRCLWQGELKITLSLSQHFKNNVSDWLIFFNSSPLKPFGQMN